jgi:uncharacterized protein (DUF2235 family)
MRPSRGGSCPYNGGTIPRFDRAEPASASSASVIGAARRAYLSHSEPHHTLAFQPVLIRPVQFGVPSKMPSKNILVFADGTGNEGGLLPDESRTNVYKLFRATRVDPDSVIKPAEQLAFYIPGIGTPIAGSHLSRGEQRREHWQQMVGGGLGDKIAVCYAALISAWRPSDRIYLFGFSRGAYTVRCLAHILELLGIPTAENENPISFEPKHLHQIARSAVAILYRRGLPVRIRDDKVDVFLKRHSCLLGADIGATRYFIGIWDTVAAIGWAHILPVKYDMHFPKDVVFARHAMAIDEYRKDFVRVPWGGSGTVPDETINGVDRFQQVWFAGNHADIGGSYPENESRLSDISLKWMADFVELELPEGCRVQIDGTRLRCSPASEGMMHDECMEPMPRTPLPWGKTVREVPDGAILHPSVYERIKLEGVRNFIGFGPYRPAALRRHTEAKRVIREADHHSKGKDAPQLGSVSK